MCWRPRANQEERERATALYDFTAKLTTGEDRSLAAYRGQPLLIVIVASKCGFTSKYKGLLRQS
nr:hypothetical protein [uncultured Rhodoblastus sp.]